MKRRSIKDRDVKNKNIDVRPPNQRESKMDTRKGMVKTNELINRAWVEKEQLLF